MCLIPLWKLNVFQVEIWNLSLAKIHVKKEHFMGDTSLKITNKIAKGIIGLH